MQMASWYYFDNGRWQQGLCAPTFHKLGIVLKLTSAHTLIGRREYLPSFACTFGRKESSDTQKTGKKWPCRRAGGNLGNTPKNMIYLIPTSDLHSTSPCPSPTHLVFQEQVSWRHWLYTVRVQSISMNMHIINLTCNVDLHHLRLWSCSLPLLERAVVQPRVVQGGRRCDEAQVRLERKLKLLLRKKTAWCLVVIESRNSLSAAAN